MVMTAQILVNSLDSKEVDGGIGAFTMIVLDECHHTALQHPFNCIMHYYMDAKYPPPDSDELISETLPQVSKVDLNYSFKSVMHYYITSITPLGQRWPSEGNIPPGQYI